MKRYKVTVHHFVSAKNKREAEDKTRMWVARANNNTKIAHEPDQVTSDRNMKVEELPC